MSTLMPFNQSKIVAYTGPPKSRKSWHLISKLTCAQKSGLRNYYDFLVVKHSDDDKHSPGKISSAGKTTSRPQRALV